MSTDDIRLVVGCTGDVSEPALSEEVLRWWERWNEKALARTGYRETTVWRSMSLILGRGRNGTWAEKNGFS